MLEKVNIEFRQLIAKSTKADFHKCWACSSCDMECPMNIATNRLRPQKMVRFAYFGLLDGLIGAPDIWYCLTCRRCNNVCPNLVKPADLIAFARMEALRIGNVSHLQVQKYYELFAKFQRVRWHAAEHCLNGKFNDIDDSLWDTWFETPIPDSTDVLSNQNLFQKSTLPHTVLLKAKASSCFTCGECSSACPISGNRNVFDPRFIFRMTNLGILNEILRSPSIWICLDCGRCTEACSQLVDGRQIVQNLQKLAIQNGSADPDIRSQIKNVNHAIYSRFLEKVDGALGINS